MKRAFTLIELLVVIAIISVIATLSTIALSSIRAKSRDTKRISDIKQIQTALEMYKNDNSVYPTNITSGSALAYGGQTYMKTVPIAPGKLDGTCISDAYVYTYTPATGIYQLTYCLGGVINSVGPGNAKATPGNIYTSINPVNTAAIAGVTAPVKGATPVTAVTATSQYSGAVTWSPTVATSFDPAQIYTATITLTALGNYSFDGVAANYFTVSGATTDTNPADSGVVTAVFPVTGAAAVGDNYQGGKLLYFFVNGDAGYVAGQTHGIVVATSDQSTSAAFGCYTSVNTNATYTSYGQATLNVARILSACPSSPSAGVCDVYTTGGYSDWYLPIGNEVLYLLYPLRATIGNFSSTYYQTSNDTSTDSNYAVDFSNGSGTSFHKDWAGRVRCIRYF